MYVSRINLDKSLGEDEYTEDKEGHTENEDDPHTEMDVLPSKQETAVYTPAHPFQKKLFYVLNLILSMVTELRHKLSNSRPSICKKTSVCVEN